MMKDFKKLNNPVLAALTETHRDFGISVGNLLAYRPDIAPFGAFKNIDTVEEDIAMRATLSEDFLIYADQTLEFPENIKVQTLSLLQMVNDATIDYKQKEEITLLNGAHEEELYTHMQKFYPGYFRRGTPKLGAYYGIFSGGKLAAVAGQRFQTDDFCEISAVVTNTAFSGRGFAKQLTAFLNNKIIATGKIPFLHVAVENEAAAGLYRKIGFHARADVTIYHCRVN